MLLVRRAGAFAALVLCFAAPASAQSFPSPSPSAAPLPEIGRVTTSDRRPESAARSTRTTFVVERATIESFGSRTVADALSNVPGVGLFSYGGFGAQAGYGIRGTTAAQTLVLRDGVPIITASTGSIDLGSLSTIGVQRIEVVENGSSTLYGTSATGGVINLISGSSPGSYARLSSGTFGDDDIALSAGVGRLGVSFERHTADNAYDYPAFAYAGGNATPAGTRSNADAQQSAARLTYVAPLAGGWSARLSAGDDAARIGVPGSLAFGLTPLARQHTSRSDAQLELARAAGGGTLSLTLAGSGQRLSYADPGPQQGGESDTYDGRTQASLRYAYSGRRDDLVTGLDVSRESAALSFVAPQTPIAAAESQAAAYAQFGYAPSAATRLTLGLRGENDAPRGKVLAPSFGLRANLGSARLTANAGESFRVPTLVDLYYPGFSNPGLLPERITDYDAALAFPSLGGGVTLGYFGRDGSNLIAFDTVTFTPVNVARIAVNGLQLTAATRPYHHLRADASITDVYRALDTVHGLRLPNTPPIIATLGLQRGFDGGALAFGARVRVVGQLADLPAPTFAPPSLADPFSAYTVADAYVRYRFGAAAVGTLRVRNLGGERYAPIFGYPAPGRTVTFELSTR